MGLSTKEYSKFKLRADNRPVCQALVKRLVESISSKNMLEFRPLIVNDKFEIIDGQHRLEAAKQLQIPVFYEVQKSIESEDMIALNISKSWGIDDFFNFWKRNGKVEYLKLQKFMDENKITIRIALNLLCGMKKDASHKFRMGKFEFNNTHGKQELQICWDSIAMIERQHLSLAFTRSAKFWKALISLCRAPNFNEEKWFTNLEKMASRISGKVTSQEYLSMLVDIHNWRNNVPIDLTRIKEDVT